VVDQAVDGRGGRHGVLEDLFPLAERQVAGQQHAAPFVTLGQKREQHLHLLAALLHVADVVDDHGIVFRQPLDHPRQLQVPLRDQQFLHQQAAGAEQDRSPLPDQFLTERTQKMGFARTAFAENEHVLSAVEEVADK